MEIGLYEAQADYRRMMEITEQLFETLAVAVNGSTEVEFAWVLGPTPIVLASDDDDQHKVLDAAGSIAPAPGSAPRTG